MSPELCVNACFPPYPRFRRIRIGVVVAMYLFCAGVWAHGHDADADAPAPVFVPLEQAQSLEAVLDRMARYRVVIVGETHDRYDHHLNQLGVIRGLHERGVDLAVGLEFFQRPFQEPLDAYVAGRLDEASMLRATEYYRRWRFDYRLYRPILAYAREQGIPLVALNMEREITDAVSERGLTGLSEAQQGRLPKAMVRDAPGYRERLKAVFDQHPAAVKGDDEEAFERFLAVQLLWDETMAETAARYLEAHSGRRMVILAGSGHVATGAGIPLRLQRRIAPDRALSVLQTDGGRFEPGDGDLLILSRERHLPPAGRLGIVMRDGEDGGVVVADVREGSAADVAGLAEGDVLVRLADRPVRETVDVRLILQDREPGERLSVRLRRPALFGGYNEETLMLTLGGASHE